MSVVLRPDDATAARLEQVAEQLLELAGEHHWPTGSRASAHVTVRPLEPWRALPSADDPQVRGYAEGLRAAAACCAPIRLRLRGLTLADAGVLACAWPADEAAEEFAACLRRTWGTSRWSDRDIWYATVVHFAGAIRDPARLVHWVKAHREWDLGEFTCDEAILTAFRYNGRQAVPVPLVSARLAASVPA